MITSLGLSDESAPRQLATGERSFAAVHLGTTGTSIGTVLDLIDADPTLRPPRTGHLGNWTDIAHARGGPMDFNAAICASGYGYPLVYGFTRTEAVEPGGDDVYLPGSLVDAGTRRPLPLYTWDGSSFALRDRSQPLLCPLVHADVDGTLMPLVGVHWQRIKRVPGFAFEQWASVLADNADLVTDVLCLLLERAEAQRRSQAFDEIISHSVRLDGTVERCDLRPDGKSFILDGHRFASALEVAQAAMLLVTALDDASTFFGGIAGLPPVLPVIALQLTNVLFGMLQTHRTPGERDTPEDPFTTHLHWGARAMAGCPPRRSGYLTRRSTIRSLRALADPLVEYFPQLRRLCFVLMPAQAFMLCPPSSEPDDVALLAELFGRLRDRPDDDTQRLTADWLGERGSALSAYVRDRFRPGVGLPVDGLARPAASSVEPQGFRDLSFRQASAVVATFEEVLACG